MSDEGWIMGGSANAAEFVEDEKESLDNEQEEEQEDAKLSPGAAQTPSIDEVIQQRDGLLADLRETRKALKESKRNQEYRDAVLQERLERLEAAATGKSEEETSPDPEDDPVGFLVWQQRQQGKKNEDALEELKGKLSDIDASTKFNSTISKIRQLEDDFIKNSGVEKEKYDKVLDSFRNVASSLFSLQGYNENQIPALIGSMEYNIASNAMSSGLNPAEEMYKLLSKSLAIQAALEDSSDGSVDKVDLNRMKDGLKASQSLSKAKGGTIKRRITLDDVADMDPDEFDKFANNPRLWAQLNLHGHVDV